MVFNLHFCQLQWLLVVCIFVCTHGSAYFVVQEKGQMCVCVGWWLGGVFAAESGYCALYHADKPIRGTTIDINFLSLPPSPFFQRCFSFNGRMTCEELQTGAAVCRVQLLERSSGCGKQVWPQDHQGGGSCSGCSEVETVEITHYPSPLCVLDVPLQATQMSRLTLLPLHTVASFNLFLP